METAVSSVEVEYLPDSTFLTWGQMTNPILAIHDLEQCVEGDGAKLEDDRRKALIKGDREAPAFIGLSLSDEHSKHVSDASPAKVM